MELNIVRNDTLYIDTDDILRTVKKEGCSLIEAIEDYVSGLDDYYYYAIGEEEIQKIKNFILYNEQ